MRRTALLLALTLPLGAAATPTTEAVDVYVKCLESEYAEAKANVAVRAEEAAFDQCSDARERLLATTSPEEAKRLVAEIDAAAKMGMEKAQ